MIIYHIYPLGSCNALHSKKDGVNRLSEIKKWIPHIKAPNKGVFCFKYIKDTLFNVAGHIVLYYNVCSVKTRGMFI